MPSCLVLALAVLASTRGLVASERPNVVFFLSDDHRADLLGCAGHEILKTPHIDRLAARGTRFANSFVTTSICAASRATHFTGLYERGHKYTFGTPPIAGDLVAKSYPVLLREAGYRTGFIGKFGVGVAGTEPKGGMFDYYVPINRNPYFHEQPDGTLRHESDECGDRAIEFLAGCEPGRPFCLQVSFNAAHAEDSDKVNHYPYPPSEEGLYEDETIPPPEISMDHWKTLPAFFHDGMHRERFHWRWDTPEKYQRNVKAYYRMITGLDPNIGRVVAELERLGLADNTVVLFMGDNGYYKGSRGFAGKWSHFEESLRVPFVVYDPRAPRSARGTVPQPMVLNVDVAPTILEYAGVPIPESYQGKSLVPLVRGQTPDGWRTDFLCEHLMHNAGIPKYEGVRGSRWVYARYFEHLPEGEFLHDLETDPLELTNIAGDPAHATVLAEMRARCTELRDQLGGEYNRERFPLASDTRKANRPRKPRGE